MEGKKYILLVLLISLTTIAFGQADYHKKIYEGFVLNEMEDWETVIEEMEEKKPNNQESLEELINYQYGFIGWSLSNNQEKQAKKYLELMESNLETFEKKAGETAVYHAYMAASHGYKIGLSNWRAPFLGPKSVEHAEKAIEKDSMNFQANTEFGNIWHHMPAVFGGSDEKALNYYQKALQIFENSENELQHKKWLYLNILATTGKLEFDRKNYIQALQFYEKALKIEPRFKWVKEELLPELNKEIN